MSMYGVSRHICTTPPLPRVLTRHSKKNMSKPYPGSSSYLPQFGLTKSFRSEKNSLIGFQSAEYGGKCIKLDSFTTASKCPPIIISTVFSRIHTHLLDLLRMVKGCVIHRKHRIWLRPPPIVMNKGYSIKSSKTALVVAP
jgi:hypothetical protein